MILLARLAATSMMMEPHTLSSHKRQLHEKRDQNCMKYFIVVQ